MDFMKMLQQAQQMQGKLAELQDELAKRTVTGAAGGGMVSVEADGKGTVRRIKIDPSLVTGGDVELLEDLVTVAVSDAQQKAAALSQDEMGKLAGGMGIPGLKLPFM
jgi:nucleoid-associated protein EbfC